MPVDLPDLEAGAGLYASILERSLGVPAVFDLVHLGLGPDDHGTRVAGDRRLGPAQLGRMRYLPVKSS
jgi:hypothetical protein